MTTRWRVLGVSVACVAVAVSVAAMQAERTGPRKPFSSTTIDLGVVVRDVDASVAFYTEAIGFEQQEGFSVDGDFCVKAGLTAGEPLEVSVLTLPGAGTAARLKLMSPKTHNDAADPGRYVNDHFGYRYTTIKVKNADAAMRRLKRAGVEPVSEGAVVLANGKAKLITVQDPDGNLIELIGPSPSLDAQ